MAIAGHQLVNADCNRFSPTKAVNSSHHGETQWARARVSRMKNPASIRRARSTVIDLKVRDLKALDFKGVDLTVINLSSINSILKRSSPLRARATPQAARWNLHGGAGSGNRAREQPCGRGELRPLLRPSARWRGPGRWDRRESRWRPPQPRLLSATWDGSARRRRPPR